MNTLILLSKKEIQNIVFEGTPTVQQVLEDSGIFMPHPCGGIGKCGKCAIEVIGNISPPDEAELQAGCRLSCRTKLYGDAIVTLKNQPSSASLIAEGFSENITPIVYLPKAPCNTSTLYSAKSGHTKTAMHLSESQNNEQGLPLTTKIGAAVDIGTTTIALSVYDLTTGHCLVAKSALNPQSAVAADVIGRIDAAINGKLSALQSMLISCIRTLAEHTGYFSHMDTWCFTGNTTMLYLLCGKNPQSLAAAPYTADHLFNEEITFFDKPAYLPACIHAFVGADITCAVLASGMYHSAETSLLCDIGTNGEMALWKNGVLYVTSTAAGPVFEGAGISCGCQSVPGAIEKVSLRISCKQKKSCFINHTPKKSSYNATPFSVSTIANATPIGICGSGIIDTLACLLNSGTLDETGYMEDDAFFLCEGISVTREDIRNIQLAKAAIAAGIRTLLEVTATAEAEISTFYLAGGFGKHLNLDSAVRIGLFPTELKDKVKVLGNAALQGAALMLTNKNAKKNAAFLAKTAKHINLGGNAAFNQYYIEEMFFPE